jgi:hypothetical protein
MKAAKACTLGLGPSSIPFGTTMKIQAREGQIEKSEELKN